MRHSVAITNTTAAERLRHVLDPSRPPPVGGTLRALPLCGVREGIPPKGKGWGLNARRAGARVAAFARDKREI